MNLNYFACVLKMFNKYSQNTFCVIQKEGFSAKLNKIENAIGILSKKGTVKLKGENFLCREISTIFTKDFARLSYII